MKSNYISIKKDNRSLNVFVFLFLSWVLTAGISKTYAQTTVGMGTEKPNPNAVLELVSERMDQGFLVPRFTTSQRTASGFTSKLSNKDNGLLVFDTEKGKFYYWHNGDWQQGMGGAATEGTSTIWYTGNIAPNNADGKNGDFYIHSPSGDVYRKQNGNFSVIGNILPKKNEYTAGKGISIGAGNAIVNTGDLDDTNELIKEVKLSGETLLISDAGGDHQVNLGSLSTSTPDADNDPANEIQDLTLSSHQLSITNNTSATPINLSPYLDNTDAQTLSFSGTDLSISGGNTVNLSSLQGGAGSDNQNLGSSKTGNNVTVTIEDGTATTFSVADADNATNNETITNMALGGDNKLTITEGGTDHIVDLSSLGGGTIIGDPSSSNELITTASLVGQELVISEGVNTHNIDLSSLGGGSDDQDLGSSKTGNNVTVTIEDGTATTFNVADADNDPANEKINSVGLIGNTLRITEAGTDYDVNLNNFQSTALDEGKVLVGNSSGIASPVSITGDVTLNSDGTMTIEIDAITTAKILNNAITTAKILNDAVDKDKIHANVAGAGLGQNADGSLEVKTSGGLQISSDQLSLTNTGNGQILIGNGSTVNAQTIGGDATLANNGAVTVTRLQGRPMVNTAPANGNVLTWNGTNWAPLAPSGGGGGSGAAWYSGNTMPIGSDPAAAADGDYYYRNSTEIVYRKVGANWIEQGKWVNQTQISTLKDEDNNDITIIEIRTPTVFEGAGKPHKVNNSAKPGDMYFNRTEPKLYIKKENGDWGTI